MFFEIAGAVIAIISEILPFLPGEHNGIFHGIAVAAGLCATGIKSLTPYNSPDPPKRTIEPSSVSELDLTEPN